MTQVADPPTITPAFEELQSHEQWVCWKLEKNAQDKLTKVPYNPQNGYKAKANDKSTWTNYEQAASVAARYDEYAGLGYEFDPEREITGIDLDHCIGEDGIVEPWAQEIIESLNSYTEYSPSKTGLHIYVRGNIPACIKRKPVGLSVYS